MHAANALDAEETSFMQSESRVFVSSLECRNVYAGLKSGYFKTVVAEVKWKNLSTRWCLCAEVAVLKPALYRSRI